jgi:hypothetical protein
MHKGMRGGPGGRVPDKRRGSRKVPRRAAARRRNARAPRRVGPPSSPRIRRTSARGLKETNHHENRCCGRRHHHGVDPRRVGAGLDAAVGRLWRRVRPARRDRLRLDRLRLAGDDPGAAATTGAITPDPRDPSSAASSGSPVNTQNSSGNPPAPNTRPRSKAAQQAYCGLRSGIPGRKQSCERRCRSAERATRRRAGAKTTRGRPWTTPCGGAASAPISPGLGRCEFRLKPVRLCGRPPTQAHGPERRTAFRQERFVRLCWRSRAAAPRPWMQILGSRFHLSPSVPPRRSRLDSNNRPPIRKFRA